MSAPLHLRKVGLVVLFRILYFLIFWGLLSFSRASKVEFYMSLQLPRKANAMEVNVKKVEKRKGKEMTGRENSQRRMTPNHLS